MRYREKNQTYTELSFPGPPSRYMESVQEKPPKLAEELQAEGVQKPS